MTWNWLEAASGVQHAYECLMKPRASQRSWVPLCGNELSGKVMRQGAVEVCCACWMVVQRRLAQGR